MMTHIFNQHVDMFYHVCVQTAFKWVYSLVNHQDNVIAHASHKRSHKSSEACVKCRICKCIMQGICQRFL